MQEREPGKGRDGMFEGGPEGYKMCEERVSSCSVWAQITWLCSEADPSKAPLLIVGVLQDRRCQQALPRRVPQTLDLPRQQ
jgi:hypothetical protein